MHKADNMNCHFTKIHFLKKIMITFLEQLEKPLFYPFWAKIKFLKNWVCQLLDFNIIYIM